MLTLMYYNFTSSAIPFIEKVHKFHTAMAMDLRGFQYPTFQLFSVMFIVTTPDYTFISYPNWPSEVSK